MAKSDTVMAIKDKFGADVDEALSQKKLDALLATADKPAFDALLANLTNGDPSNDPSETQDDGEVPEGKRRVKLGKKAQPGVTFLHPGDKITIGETPVLVTDDDWTAQKIRQEELALV
ncbi:hypothetical protein EHF33_20675 (plasmid) [Deinococcus psychrotolerans]|uniref:Uncharacterized protein n=1 Tax=Deinococcus psychrotolerans TaxID=2489213 RepID=A0A3G8YMA2_9DEIO|nr:hypothetical protein [Deinococcus psychrotolerans]AZI45327.1 hypothetical protein EHF33_20675 [Deinococcus psychrotolerans]